jgi:hypothetical protein
VAKSATRGALPAQSFSLKRKRRSVAQSLSDDFDFFFDFQFLAFHRREPCVVHGGPSGLFFNDVIQIPVPGVEFAKPLLDGH